MKQRIHWIVGILLLAFFASLNPAAAEAAGFNVVINGVTVQAAVAELRSGQLAVSVRPFAEAMNAQVSWNDAARQVTIRRNGIELAMWHGTRTSYANGTRLETPFAPYLSNGKTMVPAWWLAVRLGGKVSFDGTTLKVDTGTTQPGTQAQHKLMDPDYFFPYPASAKYDPYYNSMGDPRYYDGKSFQHEGTDIMAAKGVPIVAVASGTVVRYGWNTLGGYRVTVRLDEHPEYTFYYAHMDRYAPGLYVGAKVKAGQLLGYTGSTGEGPERTEGKFVTHLHFGIYGPNGAINPYPLLKYWEKHKVQW